MTESSAIGEMLSNLRQAIEMVKLLEEHASPPQKEQESTCTELIQGAFGDSYVP
jgi:hypothetical protein